VAEVLDYYSFTGLPRTSAWEEVKKKVNKQYLDFQKKANVKGPGSKEAAQRDFWAKALEFFKDEGAKKAYDAQLDAWLKSPAAQAAHAKAKSEAEDFAQKSTGALELLQQAWRELERGNVAEAMLLAGKALALDPGSWEAYFALGVAYFRSSDFDESMSCLRSAARLNPKSADVAAGMGEIFERQERWKDAYEQYRRASEIEPDVLVHQISMGLVCVKAGVPDEGIEILRACQAKDPNDPALNWVLGVALSESARLGWSYVQEGHPRLPEGWYAMSREQALQAVAKLREATTLRLNDPDLSKHLAALKSDVDSNIKRRFTGSWILLCLIGILALVGAGRRSKSRLGSHGDCLLRCELSSAIFN
jgi:cytochrome c-type biogenesis protein CcmH/NrfG